VCAHLALAAPGVRLFRRAGSFFRPFCVCTGHARIVYKVRRVCILTTFTVYFLHVRARVVFITFWHELRGLLFLLVCPVHVFFSFGVAFRLRTTSLSLKNNRADPLFPTYAMSSTCRRDVFGLFRNCITSKTRESSSDTSVNAENVFDARMESIILL